MARTGRTFDAVTSNRGEAVARDDQDEALETHEGDEVASAIGRGLAALVVVAVTVGLLFGLGALFMTKVVGLDGDSRVASTSSASASLYMGDGTPTAAPTTAAPKAPVTQKAAPAITLSAAPTAVRAMEQITLSGTYKEGAGSVLTVEQGEAGTWSQFGSVTVTVGGDGTFSTWIQTAQVGSQTFRVTDQDKSVSSAPVAVTIS